MSDAIYRRLRTLTPQTSRREFLQTITVLGISMRSAESLYASFQDAASTEAIVVEGPAGAVLLEQLKAMGLRYIFHTNTTGFSSILDAVDTRDVQVIMIPHEGLAVSAVEGYALAGGPMPFFMGSKVGVGHTISNLYNAWKDRTPMLVTFVGPSTRGGAGQDGFQEWDEHLNPTEPFTAWHWGCTSAQTIPEVVRRAVKFAHTPPGAPVTLDFPPDLLGQTISAPIYRMDPLNVRPAFRATASQVEQAARLIIEAKSPLLIVGSEVSRTGAQRAVVALAEKIGLPVGQADDLHCDFPTSHPLHLGSFDTRHRPLEMLTRFPEPLDVVLALGAQLGPLNGLQLIQVSTDSNAIGRTNEVMLPVLAHVSTFVADLSDAIDGMLTKEHLQRTGAQRLEVMKAFMRSRAAAREQALRAEFDDAPISWLRVGYELERALDRNAVVVPELGGNVENKVLGQLTFGIDDKLKIGRTIGAALGWGLGAAFGVQLALPDRQVVSLLGDGGILFGQTEAMWSISRYDAPVLIIVMNNHSYNETRMQALSPGGPMFQSGQELTSYLGDPDVDFSRIAAGYSIKGEKVRTPSDLTSAIARALETMRNGRPYLLDIEVAPDSINSDKATWHPHFSVAQLGRRRQRDSWAR